MKFMVDETLQKKKFEDTVTETILIKLYREKWSLKNKKGI